MKLLHEKVWNALASLYYFFGSAKTTYTDQTLHRDNIMTGKRPGAKLIFLYVDTVLSDV